MKIVVNCSVNYTFEADVPDDAGIQDGLDYRDYADIEDPVYQKIVNVLRENRIDFDGEITLIYDKDTYKTLYEI